MSKQYELRRGETFSEAFHRIAGAQLSRAEAALQDADLSIEKRIHDARKRFKEARAVCRLFSRWSGDDFEFQNRFFRDAGRLLAVYRDATATVAAVEALPREMRRAIGRHSTRALTRFVRQRRDNLYGDEATLASTVDAVLSSIAPMRIHLGSPSRGECDDSAIREGFAATVRAGRNAMRDAYEGGTDESFHEWRKRVKDHWYHVQLFVPVWPELLSVRDQSLDDLSHLLGDHHDLTVVRLAASQLPRARARTVTRINDVLAERQREIAEAARPIAERLYAPKPRALAGEVVSLWKAWK